MLRNAPLWMSDNALFMRKEPSINDTLFTKQEGSLWPLEIFFLSNSCDKCYVETHYNFHIQYIRSSYLNMLPWKGNIVVTFLNAIDVRSICTQELSNIQPQACTFIIETVQKNVSIYSI